MLYVHHIIAMAFIENQNNLKTVNHKDGNKQNNRSNNLEWCSVGDNNKHSYEKLHRTINRNGAKPIMVCMYDQINNKTHFYSSIAETARKIKLSETQIRRYINNNKEWKGRYIFTTVDKESVEDIEKVS